ncbi:MAG: biotin--[Clostridia bacterium]|nr:biotin--[acetyl-CoA-carboxylase] ligase [Clostridia bacterium]
VEYLKTKLPFTAEVFAYDEVDSTNTIARNMAVNGAPQGTVILADRQTRGRGRMARPFYSPSGTGLYMSLILRPNRAVLPLHITTAAAVAVAETIEHLSGEPTQIKWVNDVYCHGKKVCGILTEGSCTAEGLSYAILGIGINVFDPPQGFPTDLQSRAGSIFGAKTAIFDGIHEQIAAEIIERFWAFYGAFPGTSLYLKKYRARDMLYNKTVQILDVNGTVQKEATAMGIGDSFELLIQEEDGTANSLTSGEVSIRL